MHIVLNNSHTNFNKALTILLLILGTFTTGLVTANNPHQLITELNADNESCMGCHKAIINTASQDTGKLILPDMNNFIVDATNMCIGCHGDDNISHIVGITPDYTVPADLPLNSDSQITCLTCHYTHGSLKSDKPTASSSFLDLMFNRERLSKSYTLRRNNADGDLCLACHSNQ